MDRLDKLQRELELVREELRVARAQLDRIEDPFIAALNGELSTNARWAAVPDAPPSGGTGTTTAP